MLDGSMMKLPLTPESHTLYASVPNKNGKVAHENILVKMYCDCGVIADIDKAVNEVHSSLAKLEKKLEEHCCHSIDMFVGENC